MKSLALKSGLALLLADAVFWIFVLGNCALTKNCADAFVFLPYFWYMPFTYWLSTGQITVPSVIESSFLLTNIFIAVTGGAMHFVFGYLIGKVAQYLLIKKPSLK